MATSAPISRRATRNGAAPPPTGSWPMRSGSSGKRGGIVDHLDATLLCERPRLGPHREAMRQRIAEIAGLRLDQVSLKATTTEKLGFTGRGEGIAAQAAATIRLPEDDRMTPETEGPRRRAARCLQGEGPEDRDGRILHRRSRGRPADGDRRLLGRGRARLRDLFQRGQDRADRRSGRPDRRPRRRQRAGGPRHGGGSARPFPRGCDGGHHRRRGTDRRDGDEARRARPFRPGAEGRRRRSTWSGATAISGGRPCAAGPWRMRCPCWNRRSADQARACWAFEGPP